MRVDPLLVSMVIRTLNEAAHLTHLPAVIGRQHRPGPTVDTILIDSGSTDGTLMAGRNRCRISHIARDEFSFGRSLNLGCEKVRGAILFFVSGRCVPVDENRLSNLCRRLISGQASYVYHRQIGDEDSNYSERRIFPKYFPDHRPQEGLGDAYRAFLNLKQVEWGMA